MNAGSIQQLGEDRNHGLGHAALNAGRSNAADVQVEVSTDLGCS
jgi:hypothetical protein